MSWKFCLATKNHFLVSYRAGAKKRYREKFREHGINHHFLSSGLSIIVKVKTEEDQNLILLTFPNEFHISDEITSNV